MPRPEVLPDDSPVASPSRMPRWLSLGSALLAVLGSACSEPAAREALTPADLLVDAAATGKPLERNLAGIHARPKPEEVESADGLQIRFFRGVVSAGDGFEYARDMPAT